MNCGGCPLYMRHEGFWWIKTGLPKKDNFSFSQIIVHRCSAITQIAYPKNKRTTWTTQVLLPANPRGPFHSLLMFSCFSIVLQYSAVITASSWFLQLSSLISLVSLLLMLTSLFLLLFRLTEVMRMSPIVPQTPVLLQNIVFICFCPSLPLSTP